MRLLYRNNARFNIRAEITEEASGTVVATIVRETWSWGNKWQLKIKPGIDLAVICGFVAIVADIRRTKIAMARATGIAANT